MQGKQTRMMEMDDDSSDDNMEVDTHNNNRFSQQMQQ